MIVILFAVDWLPARFFGVNYVCFFGPKRITQTNKQANKQKHMLNIIGKGFVCTRRIFLACTRAMLAVIPTPGIEDDK